MLQNELGKARPLLCERIAIKFVGKVASRSGKGSYASYRVALDRPQPVDWAQYADSDIDPQPDLPQSDIPSDVPAPAAAEDDADIPF